MNNKYFIGILILVGIIKILTAIYLPLGNDEIYYLLYARYTDYHYYDHPLLVGWFIKIFSFNLAMNSIFSYRIFALVLSSITPLIIYKIVLMLSNKFSAQIAVIISISSIYFSIIAGVFVMPDAPFHFFWALSIFFAVRSFLTSNGSSVSHKDYLLCCFFLGLTCLSKFHGVFLVLGIFLFIFLYRSSFLRSFSFYLGILLLMCFTIPILLWNFHHDWVQFNFYLNRVEGNSNFNFVGPIKELLGEFGYINPVVFAFIGYFAFFKYKKIDNVNSSIFLLLTSLPFILFVISLSTVKETLPHWSGTSYFSLIILSSIVAGESGSEVFKKAWINLSISLLIIVFVLGIYVVNHFPGTIGNKVKEQTYGSGDFTLDMFGWKESAQKIRDTIQQKGFSDLPIVSDNWFPAAHIDNFICRPANIPFYCIGNIPQIHQYNWINPKRGEWSEYDSVLTIVPSNYFREPNRYLSKFYSSIDLISTVEEFRNDKKTRNYFIYLLRK
jgi:hypothetical protein